MAKQEKAQADAQPEAQADAQVVHADGCLATIDGDSHCDCGAAQAAGKDDNAAVAPSENGPAQSGLSESAVRDAMALLNPIDLDVAVGAFLYVAPAGPIELVDEFAGLHPFLFRSENQPAAAVAADRYVVETTTVFELLGSTVTFRAGQIIAARSRDFAIARDYDVPMRPLQPIVR